LKRRALSGLSSALRGRVPGPPRRRPTTQVRVYDERGHARTLDPEDGAGRSLREAADELLRGVRSARDATPRSAS
jgi:hypothetical protein